MKCLSSVYNPHSSILWNKTYSIPLYGIYLCILSLYCDMSPCFHVLKALYFSHTACAAAPLFTLCLKPEPSLLWLVSWPALLWLVNHLEMSHPWMYNKNWIQRGRRGLIHSYESCSKAHDDKMAQLLRERNVTDYPACMRNTRMCAHSACATLHMPRQKYSFTWSSTLTCTSTARAWQHVIVVMILTSRPQLLAIAAS